MVRLSIHCCLVIGAMADRRNILQYAELSPPEYPTTEWKVLYWLSGVVIPC
jgi:hypothetical protein